VIIIIIFEKMASANEVFTNISLLISQHKDNVEYDLATFAGKLAVEMKLLDNYLEEEIIFDWNLYGSLVVAFEEHADGKQKYGQFTNVESFALYFLELCSL